MTKGSRPVLKILSEAVIVIKNQESLWHLRYEPLDCDTSVHGLQLTFFQMYELRPDLADI